MIEQVLHGVVAPFVIIDTAAIFAAPMGDSPELPLR